MTSKTTPALSKPNFTSTPRTLPPYKPCPYRPHIYNSFIPTAALPMVRLEENICPTHCTHTAHRAFRILAPFSSQPSLLLSFPFACLTPAQHKKVHKGCLPDWSVQQSPSSLLCETANTSSKDLRRNKALHHCFNLNYLKCCFFFLFIYLVVLCWVKWPPAIYSKAWHILKPPLSRTNFLVLMLIYMKYNRNFTAILHFVFSSLNEFAIWLNQRVLVWIFIYSFSLARSHHPSLHVIMTPSPKSSAGGYVGLKKGTPGCLLYMKFPIWVMVKPKLFDDSTSRT